MPLRSIIERWSKGEERNLGNIISIVKDNKVVLIITSVTNKKRTIYI
jgi:hypothetical protein